VSGEREIGDAGLGWITAPARAAAGDDGNSRFVALGDEQTFVCKAVDGIDDEIITGTEQRIRIGSRKELSRGARFALGIDAAHALGHNRDLGAADIRI